MAQGLWGFYLLRGRVEKAHDFAKEVFTLAERSKDTALLMQSHFGLGNDLLWLGEFTTVRFHQEQAIKLYNPFQHRSSQMLGVNSGVYFWEFLGHVLWYLGYPDQAMEASRKGLVLANEPHHPYSVAFARVFSSWLHQYRSESLACGVLADSNVTFCTDQGFVLQMAQANVLQGWARSQQGDPSGGIAQIREGIAGNRGTGADFESPHWLLLLASACAKAEFFEEAEKALAEAQSQAHENGTRFCEAELHRLKGDLILTRASNDSKPAENCYMQAREIAQGQGARSLELRATTSLARLLRDTNRRDEARAMLADIYNWFAEGFDTADLKDAKALLDELAAN